MAHRVCTLLIAPGGKADVAPAIRPRARALTGTLTDPPQSAILRFVLPGLGKRMHFHQWKRRQVLTLLGAAAGWPLAARAQQGERVRRIGVLMHTTPDELDAQARFAAFLQGLQGAGWEVGRNLRWLTARSSCRAFRSTSSRISIARPSTSSPRRRGWRRRRSSTWSRFRSRPP